ncbi:hypothetical protein ACQKE5_11025 [Paenisporosarcina sp. NPDC076898]|uniref:hypothetical protein n=2 Tax=unclassified Paenisporosarcina TaxID=2642018 RepID=UPI003D092D0C
MSRLTGCSKDSVKEINDEIMPEDFNFSLIYGSYGKQKIDTFKDTVVKDLVEDGTIEANISFTEQEMKQIYNEMMSIDIMGELVVENENQKEECESSSPSFTKWDIQMDGKTKSTYTKNYCDDFPEDALKLIRLAEYINNILINKEEYKDLPESKGSYE